MNKSFLIIILVFALSSIVVYSAPAPWGIAINNETKECGMFWGGDEFTMYTLPEGWFSYYTNYDQIINPYGDCILSPIESPEDCCKKLGFEVYSVDEPTAKIVYNETIPIEVCYYSGESRLLFSDSNREGCDRITTEDVNRIDSCEYFLDDDAIYIDNQSKSCGTTYNLEGVKTKYLGYYSSCCSANNINGCPKPEITGTRYEVSHYPKLVTPYGECEFTRGSVETCCTQLGLTYTSSNIGKRAVYLEGRFRWITTNPVAFLMLLVFIAAMIFAVFSIIRFIKVRKQKQSELKK